MTISKILEKFNMGSGNASLSATFTMFTYNEILKTLNDASVGTMMQQFLKDPGLKLDKVLEQTEYHKKIIAEVPITQQNQDISTFTNAVCKEIHKKVVEKHEQITLENVLQLVELIKQIKTLMPFIENTIKNPEMLKALKEGRLEETLKQMEMFK